MLKNQALRLAVAVQSSDFAVALAEKLTAPQAQQTMQLVRFVGRSKAPT
jgi:hypothetical protein